MTIDAASTDPRVIAIRQHPSVGRGSCSTIDECYTDSELLQDLDRDNVKTTAAAVRWARRSENLWIEQYNEVHAAGGTGSWLPKV